MCIIFATTRIQSIIINDASKFFGELIASSQRWHIRFIPFSSYWIKLPWWLIDKLNNINRFVLFCCCSLSYWSHQSSLDVKRWSNTLLVAVFLCFTLFIFGYHYVYWCKRIKFHWHKYRINMNRTTHLLTSVQLWYNVIVCICNIEMRKGQIHLIPGFVDCLHVWVGFLLVIFVYKDPLHFSLTSFASSETKSNRIWFFIQCESE